MSRVTCVPIRTLTAFLVAIVILMASADCAGNFAYLISKFQGLCSRRCVVESCNYIGIRYGKFCGVGWTGCPGEEPCDDLDACCKVHDECVERKGMTNVKCHEKFKRCIKKVHNSGKPGFSKTCTYDTVVPTMTQNSLMHQSHIRRMSIK
uniref:Phospholipase A(2) n=1 Tax=Kalanchoe fedtschenkoi TaxID=63787 RepID=A0A7N1A3W8_KALFE